MQMRDLYSYTSIPLPGLYCPTVACKCPARREMTRFPQSPLQLSIVAFRAAWCYFTIVGVSVSSHILQWFVAYRYLGIVFFNS